MLRIAPFSQENPGTRQKILRKWPQIGVIGAILACVDASHRHYGTGGYKWGIMVDFEATRARFRLPDGVIYLDGNSLGPLPVAASARMNEVLLGEWGEALIGAWNTKGWMDLPERLGDRVGRLIGAASGTVTLGDTLSIKVFQAVSAGLSLRPERKVILSDSGNFPSDLYIAEGLARAYARGHELRVVSPDEVAGAIDDDVAVVMLTQVDYRSGRQHDMAALTRVAHDAGAIMVWDLAHSAGAVPVELDAIGADFAVGCTYKYLNGGPGSPAFIYVAKGLQGEVDPILAGWLGHASPFEFSREYAPAAGIRRFRVGTPPVLAMAALECALDIFDDVSMDDIRAQSIELMEQFIVGVEARCPELTLASPRDPELRGSQVSFAHAESYAVMQALIANGVIGDFRAPDLIRFGFTPLYLGANDVAAAVDILARVMKDRLWNRPEFKIRANVT